MNADPDVRVIVHTGNGRAFQVGADVEELDGEAVLQFQETMRTLDLKLTAWHCNVEKPVITAVNGVCAGGGLHWVADADIVIASSDASFVDPHVSIGQVSALETIALMRKMPAEAVLRMALVGSHERLSAQRAYELGMISQVVDPPEKLREVAQELAEKIAKNSPAAMRATKRALWGALEYGLTDACREGAKHLTSMWGHPDQNEGPLAFADKRDPELGSRWRLVRESRGAAGRIARGCGAHAGRLRRHVSRDQLAASAEQLGTLLADIGLTTGQVIAAMLPNDATTIAALFGTWRAGGVYTPLNPRAADAELVTQLQTLRPAAVITTPSLAQRFSSFGLPVITGDALAWVDCKIGGSA